MAQSLRSGALESGRLGLNPRISCVTLGKLHNLCLSLSLLQNLLKLFRGLKELVLPLSFMEPEISGGWLDKKFCGQHPPEVVSGSWKG